MKAVLCKEYGPPDSLVIEEVPSPEPKKGEVLLEVHAAAVNFPDVLIIENKYRFQAAAAVLAGRRGGQRIIRKVGEGVTQGKGRGPRHRGRAAGAVSRRRSRSTRPASRRSPTKWTM